MKTILVAASLIGLATSAGAQVPGDAKAGAQPVIADQPTHHEPAA